MKTSIEFIHFNHGCPLCIKVNQIQQFHKHAGLEFIWVLSGKIKVTINQAEYELQNNDILLVNHFESHKVQAESQNYYVMHFYIDSLFYSKQYPGFYELLFDLKSFHNSRRNQQPYDVIRTLLSQLCLNAEEFLHHQTSFSRLLQYMTNRFSQKSTLLYQDKKSLGEETVVQQIVNKVEHHFKRKITLNEIALEYHYNSSYLSDLFKKSMGMTFKAYLDETRLRYSLYLLHQHDLSIMDIALNAGFSDEKSFYKIFKNKWSVTPFQLRKQYIHKSIWTGKGLNIDDSTSSNSVIKYYRNLPIEQSVLDEHISTLHMRVNLQQDGYELKRSWNKMVNVGSASSLLVQNVQNQLKEMQNDIKFEFVRFEGIFNQEMEVLQLDKDGYKYNWKFVNHILDFLLDIDAKPFISLSYMPKLLASSDTNLFNYRSNTSPPKEMCQWLSLVQSFLINCLNHYGEKVVSQWYFQVWTEFPINGIHWSGTFIEYVELYKHTAFLIKGLSPNLKVGPASENFYSGDDKLSEQLLEYCRMQHVPIDFYACNIYHNQIRNLNDFHANFVDYKGSLFHYNEQSYTKQRAAKSYKLLRKYFNEQTEFIITRWNFSWDVKNYLHDTVFMATFILDNMLCSSSSLANSIGYLSASDILYEWSINNHPFYGGSGIVNTEGVKKAAYYAFVFLAKLGNRVIEKGNNYIVTKLGNDIQILIFNHAYPNQLYCQGDDQLKDSAQRYECFEEKNSLLVTIRLNQIYGTYKCKRFSLNRENGSAFDEWVRLGGLPDMNQEEIAYLKRKSYPNLSMGWITCEGHYEWNIQVPVHGVEFITLHQVYK